MAASKELQFEGSVTGYDDEGNYDVRCVTNCNFVHVLFVKRVKGVRCELVSLHLVSHMCSPV